MKRYTTDSEIDVKSHYNKHDIIDKLENPGEIPFTRGIHSEMYKKQLWTMRQYTGYGSAEETNKRFKFLINKGQTGLSLAFDLPTQLGLNSDNNLSEGEVGKVGVSINSLYDMKILFDKIDLNKISTSMTINSTAAILLGLYAAVGNLQGYDSKILRGTVQNDILKEYISRNTHIYPPKQSVNLTVDLIEFCVKNMPNWYPISISGYHIREAGATAIQELGFTFSNAIEYINQLLNRGLKIDEFAPRLSFFLVSKNDFFEEIAKFRAARRIWSKIIGNRFESKNKKSMQFKFHVQTSGETLTAQQPENNVIRVSIQALAAVLGGAQSIHTNSKDEALGLPTEEAVKIALRTQQIIASESGVIKTVDPLGGSYYVEYLTDKIEEEVMNLINKIDKLGGSLKAIESGYMQSEIQKNAYKYQCELDEKSKIIVGVNDFIDNSKNIIKRPNINSDLSDIQHKNLTNLKKIRNSYDVEKSLQNLEVTISSGENTTPIIFDSVKKYVTIEEICNVFRELFGEY